MPTKYQLKNGMNVLLIESKKSPVVSIQMWVKTGSADEKKGIEGISHFIEHLVFKGSEKFKTGEMAQLIEGSGGVLNAYTTFDQTVFYVTLSKNFVDSGLEVISEMMGRPKFDSGEIDNEREVVIEEIKRSLDNPYQQASRLLFSTMYEKHPYGIPVIGYDDNIRRVKREEIVDYYQKRYVPQNMNLVVVGDFDTAVMKKKIKTQYESFEKNKLLKVKRAAEKSSSKPKLRLQKSVFNESILYFSWPCPNAEHKDAVALLALSMILGQGDSSRLVHQLRNEKHLVNSIGASVFSPKDPGFFALSTALNQERILPMLEGVQSVICDFIKNGPTEAELRKAVRQIESEKLYSMETVDGLAGLYGHFEFLHKDYRYFDKVLKQIGSLTCGEIQSVARKYLNPRKMNVCLLAPVNPEEIKGKIEKWRASLSAQFDQSAKSPTAPKKRLKNLGVKWQPKAKNKTTAPKFETLKSGLRVVTQKIAGAPVVSLRLGFLGGLRFEKASESGVNELTSRVWATGTRDLSEHEFNIKIEDMAAQLGAFGGRNSIGLSATALAPDTKEILGLVSDLLVAPRCEAAAIEREKGQMLENLKSRNDKPAQRCMLNLTEMMFEGHPYARDPIGTVETIANLRRENVIGHIEKVQRAKGGVVVIVGDFSESLIQKNIEKIDKALDRNSEKSVALSLAPMTKNRHRFVALDKEQSHVALAYRGLKIGSPERHTLEIMQSVLSGQGGRLFLELRDKASLAYTVSPIRMDGLEGGYFGAYIGCSPEKAKKAIAMMKTEFRKLMETDVSAAELERAKKYLLGRYDIARQRTSNLADSLLFDVLYGLGVNESETYRHDLEAVTAKDVRDLAAKIFNQSEVVSIVGREDVSE
jgi:zinc protease